MDGSLKVTPMQSETTGEELDSFGEPSPLPPGTRVTILQVPWRGMKGVVEKQYLHHDGSDAFWGNIILLTDDGQRMHMNCWQVEKEINDA